MIAPLNKSTWWFHVKWSARNLCLYRVRSLLTGTGVAVAVAILVSVLALRRGYERALEESIRAMGFQVLVTAKGCPYEAASMILRGGQIPMYIDEQIYRRVAGHPEVQAITKLFIQTLPVDHGRRTQFFTGVERSYLEMKPWVRLQRGGWFSSQVADEAILGYNAAGILRLDVGDALDIEQFGRPLRVVGVLDRTGSQDDGAVLLPLHLAQKLFDRQDKLTGLGVRVRDVRRLDRFIADIYDLPSVQVVALAQVQSTLLRLVRSSQMLMVMVGLFAAIVAALAVVNTVLMSVFERTREFGVLRAIGGPRSRLFGAVCLETAALSTGGAITGCVMAGVLGGLIEQLVRRALPFAPTGAILKFDPAVMILSVIAAGTLGVGCALYPAYRATSRQPMRSLRLAG